MEAPWEGSVHNFILLWAPGFQDPEFHEELEEMGLTGELALTIYLNNDLDRDTVVYLEEVIVHGYELAITYPNLLDDEDFCDDGTRLIGVIRKF